MRRIIVGNQHARLYGPFNTYNLDKVAAYKVHGAWYSAAHRSGEWDGKKRLYRKCPSGYYKIPSGFVDGVCKLLDEKNIQYELEDNRDFLCADPVYELHGKSLTNPPRDYQAEILDAVVAQNGGVIHAFTGAGKTVCGAAILKSFNVPSLFLTHRRELLYQTHEAFSELLQTPIGIIGDQQCQIEKFTVGMVQTLSHPRFTAFLKNTKVVVADEVHHLESKQWCGVFDRLGAIHKYGLTATPSFAGPGLALIGYTGPTIYSITPEEGIRRGVLVPPEIYFIDYTHPKVDCKPKDAFSVGVSRLDERTDATVRLAVYLKERGIRPLFLFRWIYHADSLMVALGRFGVKAKIIQGKTKKSDRKKYLAQLKSGELDAIIGQVQIMGEGVDIPYLQAVVNVTGMRGGGSSASDNEADVGRLTAQIIGRALRSSPGKEKAYYFDFNDASHEVLEEATEDRKQALRDYGYGQYFRDASQLV